MATPRSELAAYVLAALTSGRMGLFVTDVRPVAEGEQNFVFACSTGGKKSILKVTDSRHRSRDALATQLAMLGRLERDAPNIVAPRTLGDSVSVVELEIAGTPFYLVAYPYAAGRHPTVAKHGYRMGRVLAELHAAMRRLPSFPFPKVGAGDDLARVKMAARALGASERFYTAALRQNAGEVQLLHGDFSAANLKLDGPETAIFDFDNCVYGSPAYELANSLYMVLFDQMRQYGDDLPYRNFRRTFLDGYGSSGGEPPDETAVDALISYRVLLLASWLQAPDNAPLFIRQSSPPWLGTLQTFVRAYFERLHDGPGAFT